MRARYVSSNCSVAASNLPRAPIVIELMQILRTIRNIQDSTSAASPFVLLDDIIPLMATVVVRYGL